MPSCSPPSNPQDRSTVPRGNMAKCGPTHTRRRLWRARPRTLDSTLPRRIPDLTPQSLRGLGRLCTGDRPRTARARLADTSTRCHA
eukprot:333713-Rhodomonas_salina.2